MSAPARRMNRRSQLLAVILGLVLPLLIVEIGIRLVYGSLPGGMRIALRFVRLHPFTDQRLAPLPLWASDRDYQTVIRPGERDVLQVGSINLQFRASTYNWWGGRVGFRTPQPETGRVEAVALGDSHTFCFVDDADCWVSLLSAQIGLPVANLGQPITGSISHERLFWDYVAKPELNLGQPKLVLWQFFGNDYNDDYGMARLQGTNKTPPAQDPLDDFQASPSGSVAQWLTENSAIYAMLFTMNQSPSYASMFVDPYRVTQDGVDMEFGRTYTVESFDMTQARNQEGEQLSHEAILHTREIVEKNGGRFVVLLMPAKEEVYRHLTEPKMGAATLDALAQPRLRLLDFCAAQKLTCLDLTAPLSDAAKSGPQLFHFDDLHMNAEGNRVLAGLLADYLRQQGIVQGVVAATR